MQAKTDGITSVVTMDNSVDFSQLFNALPQECRVAIAWGLPESPSGVTLNRLGDKIKIVHMYFADSGEHASEYATVGLVAPISNLVWSQFPSVATVTEIASSPQSKIDEYSMEIRYRAANEPTSNSDSQWITKLGIPIYAAAISADTGMTAAQTAAQTASQTASQTAAQTAAQKLIGKWGVDLERMADMEEIKKMPEDKRKAALEMTKSIMGNSTFEFTSDKLIINMMGQKKEGNYKVKSEEGDKVVIEGTMDGKIQILVAVFNGDLLTLGKDKQTFPLKRKTGNEQPDAQTSAALQQVAAALQQTLSNAVSQSALPSTPNLMPAVPVPQLTPIVSTILEEQKKINYIPWIIGGVVLLFLLRK